MDAYRKVWICLAVAVLGLGLAAAAVQLALMSPAASVVLLVVGVVTRPGRPAASRPGPAIWSTSTSPAPTRPWRCGRPPPCPS